MLNIKSESRHLASKFRRLWYALDRPAGETLWSISHPLGYRPIVFCTSLTGTACECLIKAMAASSSSFTLDIVSRPWPASVNPHGVQDTGRCPLFSLFLFLSRVLHAQDFIPSLCRLFCFAFLRFYSCYFLSLTCISAPFSSCVFNFRGVISSLSSLLF
jgi:hypothetical protein